MELLIGNEVMELFNSPIGWIYFLIEINIKWKAYFPNHTKSSLDVLIMDTFGHNIDMLRGTNMIIQTH